MIFIFLLLAEDVSRRFHSISAIYIILRIHSHNLFINAGTHVLPELCATFTILLTAFIRYSEYSFVLESLDCCLDCFVLVCR